jgi:hypothetical protein
MYARNYTAAPEAGTLTIDYNGEHLDMNAIAVIHLNLQVIAENVLENMLDDNIPQDMRRAFSPGITGRFEYSLNPTIRLVPTEIRIGSLFESVIPFIPLLADADVRAAMQGVLGNIIFTIGCASFGAYFSTETKGQPLQPIPTPIDVGANIAAIAVALAQHGPHALKIKYTGVDGSVTEVEINPGPKGG